MIDLKVCTLHADANPFRGLFWGCLISSLLWMSIVTAGIRPVRWIIGIF